ncbi:hypothetical protein [Luteolibacter sp. AS25]|uniref:hypothetical protein n=1 Tax=Luteolibacter sp. AS25 TaxID=3135776 RepID=UPI00398B9E45
MKTKTALALITLAFTPFAFSEEDHSGHDHASHDHSEHAESALAGPNQGRILTEVEPHLEFFVKEDRKIQLTFTDDEGKAITPTGQTASAIGGDRSSPTRLSFAVEGDSLVSDKALPEGKDIPIVLMVKTAADAKTTPIKFNINMNNCPSCEHLEYACTCAH